MRDVHCSGLKGNVSFIAGKPVVGGRYNLWSPQFESVDSLTAKLLAAPRTPHTADGYSLIPVHVWSHNTSDVAAVAQRLREAAPLGVRVVHPAEFLRAVAANIAH